MRYAPIAFSMATPIRGLRERGFLRVAMRLAQQYRQYAPLKRIGTIHVAGFAFVRALRDRWGIPRRLDQEFLMFVSLFDGGADQYLSDFGVVVPDEIDSIWGKCAGYPGARDSEPFVRWVQGHQFTLPGDTLASYIYDGYTTDAAEPPPPPPAKVPPGESAERRLALLPLVLNALDLRRRLRRLRSLLHAGASNERLFAELYELVAETPIGQT